MIPLNILGELFNYNYWARDRQLKACATLTPEQFLRPMGNSFSSLRDTLAHLAGCEWLWLERWRGRSPRAMANPQEFPNLETIKDYWNTVEEEVRAYLAELDEDILGRPLTYINFNGETWDYPLGQTILHLLNHQSYHRGQVTTLLRQLGVEPAPVDFLVAYDVNFEG